MKELLIISIHLRRFQILRKGGQRQIPPSKHRQLKLSFFIIIIFRFKFSNRLYIFFFTQNRVFNKLKIILISRKSPTSSTSRAMFRFFRCLPYIMYTGQNSRIHHFSFGNHTFQNRRLIFFCSVDHLSNLEQAQIFFSCFFQESFSYSNISQTVFSERQALV